MKPRTVPNTFHKITTLSPRLILLADQIQDHSIFATSSAYSTLHPHTLTKCLQSRSMVLLGTAKTAVLCLTLRTSEKYRRIAVPKKRRTSIRARIQMGRTAQFAAAQTHARRQGGSRANPSSKEVQHRNKSLSTYSMMHSSQRRMDRP